jgi:DNA-binding MarR family transcriptional regulator
MHPITFGLKRAFLTSTTFLRRQLRRHFKLTPARFDVLYLVYRGTTRQRDIRRLLGLTSSTISEMLQTLERLRLVWRKRSYTDGRARVVQLTAKGLTRTAACAQQWITYRAGLRMVRNMFFWKNDPDRAFTMIDDYESSLIMTQQWFTGTYCFSIYPGWHPDD